MYVTAPIAPVQIADPLPEPSRNRLRFGRPAEAAPTHRPPPVGLLAEVVEGLHQDAERLLWVADVETGALLWQTGRAWGPGGVGHEGAATLSDWDGRIHPGDRLRVELERTRGTECLRYRLLVGGSRTLAVRERSVSWALPALPGVRRVSLAHADGPEVEAREAAHAAGRLAGVLEQARATSKRMEQVFQTLEDAVDGLLGRDGETDAHASLLHVLELLQGARREARLPAAERVAPGERGGSAATLDLGEFVQEIAADLRARTGRSASVCNASGLPRLLAVARPACLRDALSDAAAAVLREAPAGARLQFTLGFADRDSELGGLLGTRPRRPGPAVHVCVSASAENGVLPVQAGHGDLATRLAEEQLADRPAGAPQHPLLCAFALVAGMGGALRVREHDGALVLSLPAWPRGMQCESGLRLL